MVAAGVMLGLGAAIALVFAVLGFRAYRAGTARDERLAARRPGLQQFLGGAWGIDEAYESYVVQPVRTLDGLEL